MLISSWCILYMNYTKVTSICIGIGRYMNSWCLGPRCHILKSSPSSYDIISPLLCCYYYTLLWDHGCWFEGFEGFWMVFRTRRNCWHWRRVLLSSFSFMAAQLRFFSERGNFTGRWFRRNCISGLRDINWAKQRQLLLVNRANETLVMRYFSISVDNCCNTPLDIKDSVSVVFQPSLSRPRARLHADYSHSSTTISECRLIKRCIWLEPRW